ncbi:MAG: 50S ribosomal protein L25, partial [Neisseriaceae bacterium]|nr:50S ribosomal protein L25 [Neisseriaceae bacterium]
MSEKLTAMRRDAQGTGASRRLRREGFIPAVVYGDNQEPLSISVEHNAVFYELQKEKFHTTV